MAQIPSNGLRLTTLFIAGSMLLSSLTGCGVYKDWKQKEETRLMQTTREAILGELAERKANEEANKNWLQRHWTGVSIGILTTWAVGITAFMIFKWPKDGKQGPQGIKGIQGDPGIQGFQGRQGKQGPAGVQGVAGKDGVPAELLEQIRKNTTDIQQASDTATRAEDAVKQQSEIIVPLKEKVEQQEKDIKEAKDAAQIAQNTAQIGVNGSGQANQRLDDHHLRIEALEKAAVK